MTIGVIDKWRTFRQAETDAADCRVARTAHVRR
jgi:hypothetical protein